VEASGFTLAILGAAAVVAALAGQLNLAGVAEFPLMQSSILRILLFVVGGFFFFIGLGLIGQANTVPGPGPEPGPSVSPSPEPSETTSPDPPPTTVAPIPTSYEAAANAACLKAQPLFQKATAPPQNADDEQLSQASLTYAAALEALWNGLANVAGQVPADHETLLFKLEQYHDNIEDAGYALRAGDPYTYENNWNNEETLRLDYNLTAEGLQLAACTL
jgi:hypothetical protein